MSVFVATQIGVGLNGWGYHNLKQTQETGKQHAVSNNVPIGEMTYLASYPGSRLGNDANLNSLPHQM